MIRSLDFHRTMRLIPGYDPFATAGGCWFDEAAARHAIGFFADCLKHIEGKLAGEPFTLRPWQQAIVGNLFGWKRAAKGAGRKLRRYREALLFVPRKNGKTPKVAGIGLYHLFCEPERGQQNYIAASTREQAGLVMRHCRGMVEQEPELNNRCRIFGGNAPGGQSQSIVRESVGSFLKIISADSRVGKHGKNTNIAIVDELHEQPDRDLVDSLRTSMASANKPQPLMIYATTSDYERAGSICNEIHGIASKVRDGIIDNPQFLPVIYEAGREDDWTSEKVWESANPNIDISVDRNYLRAACKQAQENPVEENLFKRLHLNIRTEQSVRMIVMDQWDACGCAFNPEILRGRPCYLGLDLATVDDLAAAVLVFPPADEDEPFYALSYFWCPEATAAQREHTHGVPYLTWARQGHIELTPGRSIDYRYIRKRINELAQKYQIIEIPFDPYNASHIATELGEEDGFTMVLMRQGMLSMNEPTKLLLRLLLDGRLRHGGHPVLRWMACNAAGQTDAAGNVKPDKAASAEKIDGIVALIMGLGRAGLCVVPTNPYDDGHEILTVSL